MKSSEVLPAELLTSNFEVLMIRTFRTRPPALIKKGLRGLLIVKPFRFLVDRECMGFVIYICEQQHIVIFNAFPLIFQLIQLSCAVYVKQ